MARVLITGMSGTGKTTVLDELHRRGHLTLDTDYDGWVLADGTWDEPRMDRFLREHAESFVSGAVENQRRFYDRFEHVVLFSAPLEVILRRVAARSDNPYGKSAQERDEIAENLRTVEPLLRRGATLELDARLPVAELADELERLLPPVTLTEPACLAGVGDAERCDVAEQARFLAAVPALAVSEERRAVAFLQQALGFVELQHEGRGLGILRRDQVELHVWVADGSAPGAERHLAGSVSCRIEVTGVDELYDHCRELGVVHPNAPLSEKPWGTREFAVLDPDNNLIALYERVAPA